MNTPNLDALIAQASEEHGDDVNAILRRCDLDDLFSTHGPALVAVLKRVMQAPGWIDAMSRGDLDLQSDIAALLTQLDQEATCQK